MDEEEPASRAAALRRSAEGVKVYKGFTEHAYRLVFPYTDQFPDKTPQHTTILPNGVAENSKSLVPKAEEGLICYTYAQSIRADEENGKPVDEVAAPHLDTPYVWSRDDGSYAVVQCWPTKFNQKFLETFQLATYSSDPMFEPQAVEEFKRAIQSQFGEDAVEKQRILYCKKATSNRMLTYIGKSENLISYLASNDDLQQALLVKDVSVENCSFVSLYTNKKDAEAGLPLKEKSFAMHPGTEYALYIKKGWETMACIKLLDQFNSECDLHPSVEGALMMYKGFTEFSYRLVFNYEDNFPDQSPQLHCIVPKGSVENSTLLEPKAEKGFQTYAYPQFIAPEQIAECTLPQKEQAAFIFKRDADDQGAEIPVEAKALVQSWAVKYDDSFKANFQIWDDNPDPSFFNEMAVKHFKYSVEKLFGEDATEKVKIKFAKGFKKNTRPVYIGSSEAIMHFLTTNPKVVDELNIQKLFHDGTALAPLAFVSGILKLDWKTKIQSDGGSKGFTMDPGAMYALYTKLGGDELACVKPIRQFNNECEVEGEGQGALDAKLEDIMKTKGVSFYSQSATLLPESQDTLREVAALLRSEPAFRLKVYAYATKNEEYGVTSALASLKDAVDDLPSDVKDMESMAGRVSTAVTGGIDDPEELSRKRAQTVRTALKDLGLRNINVKGCGEVEGMKGCAVLSRCTIEELMEVSGAASAAKVSVYDGFTKKCVATETNGDDSEEHPVSCYVGTTHALLQYLKKNGTVRRHLKLTISGDNKVLEDEGGIPGLARDNKLVFENPPAGSPEAKENAKKRYVLYKNDIGQQLPVIEELEEFQKTCTFYMDVKKFEGYTLKAYRMLFDTKHVLGGDQKLESWRQTVRKDGAIEEWDNSYRGEEVGLLTANYAHTMKRCLSEDERAKLAKQQKPYVWQRPDLSYACATIWPTHVNTAFREKFKPVDPKLPAFDDRAVEEFKRALAQIFGWEDVAKEGAIGFYCRQETYKRSCYVGTGEALMKFLQVHDQIKQELHIKQLVTNGFEASILDRDNRITTKTKVSLMEPRKRYCLFFRAGWMSWAAAKPLEKFLRDNKLLDEVKTKNVLRRIGATDDQGGRPDPVAQRVEATFRMLSWDMGHGKDAQNKAAMYNSVEVTFGKDADEHRQPNMWFGISRMKHPSLGMSSKYKRQLPGLGLHGLTWWSSGDLVGWRHEDPLDQGPFNDKTNLFPGDKMQIHYAANGNVLVFCKGSLIWEYDVNELDENTGDVDALARCKMEAALNEITRPLLGLGTAVSGGIATGANALLKGQGGQDDIERGQSSGNVSAGSAPQAKKQVFFHLYVEDQAQLSNTWFDKTNVQVHFRRNNSCMTNVSIWRQKKLRFLNEKILGRSMDLFDKSLRAAVKRISVTTWKALRQHHKAGVRDIALVQGGHILISVSADKTVKFFSSSGRCLKTTSLHSLAKIKEYSRTADETAGHLRPDAETIARSHHFVEGEHSEEVRRESRRESQNLRNLGRAESQHSMTSSITADSEASSDFFFSGSIDTSDDIDDSDKPEPQCVAAWNDVADNSQQEGAYVVCFGRSDGWLALWKLSFEAHLGDQGDPQFQDQALESSIDVRPLMWTRHDETQHAPAHRRGVLSLVYDQLTHALYCCGGQTVGKFIYTVDRSRQPWKADLEREGGWQRVHEARQIALSPDGMFLAAAVLPWHLDEHSRIVEARDGDVRLLRTSTGDCCFSIGVWPAGVTSVAIALFEDKKDKSRAGGEQWLFFGDTEGDIHCYEKIHELVSEQVIDATCQTDEEGATVSRRVPDHCYKGHAKRPIRHIMPYRHDFPGKGNKDPVYFIASCSENGIVMMHPLRAEDIKPQDWQDESIYRALHMQKVVPFDPYALTDDVCAVDPKCTQDGVDEKVTTEVKQIWQFVGHQDACVRCVRDGENIYTASMDHSILQWNFQDIVEAYPPEKDISCAVAFKRMTFAKFPTGQATKVPVALVQQFVAFSLLVFSNTMDDKPAPFFVFAWCDRLGWPYAPWAKIGFCICFAIIALVACVLVGRESHYRYTAAVDKVDAEMSDNPQMCRQVQSYRTYQTVIYYYLNVVVMFLGLYIYQFMVALMDCAPFDQLDETLQAHVRESAWGCNSTQAILQRDNTTKVLEIHPCIVCRQGEQLVMHVLAALTALAFFFFTSPLLIVQGDVTQLHRERGSECRRLSAKLKFWTWALPTQNQQKPYVGAFTTDREYWKLEVGLLVTKIGYPVLTDMSTNNKDFRIFSYFGLGFILVVISFWSRPFKSWRSNALVRLACLVLCLIPVVFGTVKGCAVKQYFEATRTNNPESTAC
eukprot:TRINITY_DN7287_c0_g1_i1.p1 TRINITY_DN7287_c0_g1~~TRINITY_DN7287_c0_g1_i1.p1  ORF type:complete len:2305 (-),score=471.63 TRINITY_DN7287_c0_g1_i1:133-7047(-)